MSALYDFLQSAYRSGLAAISKLSGYPFRYYRDGLFTIHNADFMRDPDFARAYAAGMRANGRDLQMEWRVHVCCWAARHALRYEGDFVECGVNTGIYARAIVEYVAFEKLARRFYLLDTFEGMPAQQFTPQERRIGLARRFEHGYGDVYEATRATFEKYANVVLVKGRIPETLASVPATKVAYLSIDLNAVAPEVAAAEHFWDRLVAGGIIILDDYGWPFHDEQKAGFDRFAQARGVSVLALPTGQGIIIKP